MLFLYYLVSVTNIIRVINTGFTFSWPTLYILTFVKVKEALFV